ncbi:sce7726 family protein [Alkalimonas sp. NCh-2]|uniref:sce7726 family protein n=1 Tax=Alkalimonas sp. NCh-2 TaxID=3144846 RepID=UPI0031F70436
MRLNDLEIRKALINKLETQTVKPRAIVEELRVYNGNAIADVVALYSEAHCYEIKGEDDKVERVLVQSKYYNSSFRKITLVTTVNHIEKATSICPDYWGIVVAFSENEAVKFRHIRGAKTNPDFSKELALLTLWKSEMLSILEEPKHQRKPRDVLAQLISSNKKKAELSSNICDLLITRRLDTAIC